MDLRLDQGDDGLWTVVRAGTAIATGLTHEAALLAIQDVLLEAAAVAAEQEVDAEVGLLPEAWEIPVLCETAATGPSRTFENCVWSSLDPANNIVPLWLSTSQEGGGHLGARLAGYFTSIEVGPTPRGAGRFYDNDVGEEARNLLLGGRTFGISADPTEQVTYDVECLEMDPEGMYCVQDRVSFTAYEIGGATMTPSPGFHNAHIVLASAPVEENPEPGEPADEGAPLATEETEAPVVASGAEPCCDACATRGRVPVTADLASRRAAIVAGGVQIPVAPPRAWFENPGFDRLTPVTIEDGGRFYGHLAPLNDPGACHTGSPQGACVLTPRSNTGYAYFLTGYIVCDDGSEVAVGRYTLGGGHADQRLSHRGAAEHYDNAGAGIADVTVGEDEYGIWMAGALTPGVTPEQIRLARVTSPSGDWRPVGRGLELVAALAVNQPGFPAARVAAGRVEALVAAGAPVMASLTEDREPDRVARLEALVRDLNRSLTGDSRASLVHLGRERLRERLRATV